MFHIGDSDSDEDEEITTQVQKQNNNAGDYGFTDSEDEDSENRKVLSPMEKFQNSLKRHLNAMIDLSDQFNWAGAYEQFQELQRLVKKNSKLVRVQGPPEYYLIYMNRFMEALGMAKKDELKNYEGKNKSENASKFSRMQNELLKKKKYPWCEQMRQFKEQNPDKIWAEEEEQDDEEEDVLGDDQEDFNGDDFDDDDFGFSDSEEPSSGTGEKTSGVKPDMYKREFWLKKEYQPAWMQKKESEKANSRAARQKKREAAKLLDKEDDGAKEGKKEKVWNDKSVKRLIDTVLCSKGSVDRSDRRKFVESLKLADSKCQRVQWKMMIKLLLIENLLDLYTPPRCLKRGAWHDIIQYCTDLIELLREHPHYRLHLRGLRKLELNEQEKEKMLEAEQAKEPKNSLSTFGHGLADAENMLKKEQVLDDDIVEGLSEDYYWLRGNFHSICTRLSDDLIIAFKKSDIKNEEYEERRGDKELLVKLCVNCREYIRDVTNNNRMEQLKFRHLFVKLTYEDYDKDWDSMAQPKKLYVPFELKPETRVLENVLEIFSEIREFDMPRPAGELSGAKLFGAEDVQVDEYRMLRDKMKVESVLYLVHYLAIHHHFLIARDILAAWHRGKENDLAKAEISIQILYNRTLARLAIAAFTHEDWMTSMMLLQRLYITGKIKELLAQGVKSDLRWKHNKTPDEVAQEQQEKQRMVPQHTFIDNDLLESVHYVSSLFFEMKAILQSEGDETRVQNRSFRRQWEYRQKREFLAPPENTRDTILEAGAKMLKGNWKACLEHLRSLKCWEHFEYADVIKEKVERRAKTECLRCYLMSSSKHFSDIELKVLSEKFEMSEKRVIKLCSQFIIEQDVKASIDLPGGYLFIHEPLPTQFETSAEDFHHQLTHFFAAIKDAADMLKVNVSKSNTNREKRRDQRQEGRSNGGKWR